MDAYVGEIRSFAFGVIPKNWAQCNGQLMNIRQNQALYALLGTRFGGDGTNTFALPDLRSRVPIGVDQDYSDIGKKVGVETVTLTAATVPPHSHNFSVVNAPGTQPLNVSDDYLAQISVFVTNATSESYTVNGYTPSLTSPTTLTPKAISSSGGSLAHENRQPYLAINFCISLVGIFPSRP